MNGNEHIITYEDCLKTRFGVSCRAYYIFRLLGFNNVNVLDGGWESWIKEKYPVTTEVTQFSQGSFRANWNVEVFANKEDILQSMDNSKRIIVDVRD
ncbi:MAG: sulfurtransferase [Flammeovirgaceae bacterium]